MALPPDRFGAYAQRFETPPGALRLAVKDVIGVAGAEQQAGIPARAGRIAQQDAAVIEQMRAAGWHVSGTTITDSAGFGTMTTAVANPRDPLLSVGGSSGGSGAAVAAGLADAALGTDTGGSVRIPAAYCGLYGFKPTLGRVPLDGVLAMSDTFDTVGVLAADPDTLRKAAAALLNEPIPWRAPLIFALDASAVAECDPSVSAGVLALADSEGWREVDEPVPYEVYANTHSDIICAESAAIHRDDFARAPGGFPPLAYSGVAHGLQLSPQMLESAHRTTEEAGRIMREAVQPSTALVSPTLPMRPLHRFADHAIINGIAMAVTSANVRLTTPANVSGLPALAVPFRGGSLHFTGAAGEDAALIAGVLYWLSRQAA